MFDGGKKKSGWSEGGLYRTLEAKRLSFDEVSKTYVFADVAVQERKKSSSSPCHCSITAHAKLRTTFQETR
jgi:hypothetical protein